MLIRLEVQAVPTPDLGQKHGILAWLDFVLILTLVDLLVAAAAAISTVTLVLVTSHSKSSSVDILWHNFSFCVCVLSAACMLVRWMCGVKIQEFQVKGWERETRIRWQSRYCSKTGWDGMGMCCKKKTMIAWRNVWSMKLRVPGQEVDPRKLGERLWKKTVRHVNWTGRMPWIVMYGGSR